MSDTEIKAQLLNAPPTIGLNVGNKALGIGRSTGYSLAKRGDYPCKVLRVGATYRIVTADLLRLLDLAPAA